MFFFIGIFGIQDKQKTIREFNNVVCSYCGSLSRAELIEQYTYFHFSSYPYLDGIRDTMFGLDAVIGIQSSKGLY